MRRVLMVCAGSGEGRAPYAMVSQKMKSLTIPCLVLIVLCLSGCSMRDDTYIISARQLSYITGQDTISYNYPVTTIVESFRQPNVEIFDYFKGRLALERILSDPILRVHIVDTIVISELGLTSKATDAEVAEAIQSRKRVDWISSELDYFKMEFAGLSPNANRILADLHVVSLRKSTTQPKTQKEANQRLQTTTRSCPHV